MSGDFPAVVCDPDELLALVRSGNLQALDRMTRCYGQRLQAVGRRYCGDEDKARDAVQDALLSAGTNLESFRGDGSIEGWLIRMVANACHRMQRGRKNRNSLHTDIDDLELAEPEEGSPELAALRAQLADALGRALLSLEPKDRVIMLLSDAEDWKAPEIAESLGMTSGSVRTRLSRARQRLRTDLEGAWHENSA